MPALGGAASPWVKYSGSDGSRITFDLCRFRFEEDDEGIECFNGTLASLLALSPAEVWPEALVWCGAQLMLNSDFLLVPWCRSDPGIPHADVATTPAT